MQMYFEHNIRYKKIPYFECSFFGFTLQNFSKLSFINYLILNRFHAESIIAKRALHADSLAYSVFRATDLYHKTLR